MLALCLRCQVLKADHFNGAHTSAGQVISLIGNDANKFDNVRLTRDMKHCRHSIPLVFTLHNDACWTLMCCSSYRLSCSSIMCGLAPPTLWCTLSLCTKKLGPAPLWHLVLWQSWFQPSGFWDGPSTYAGTWVWPHPSSLFFQKLSTLHRHKLSIAAEGRVKRMTETVYALRFIKMCALEDTFTKILHMFRWSG